MILPVCAAIGMLFQVGYVTVVPALSGPARITEANGLLYGAAGIAAAALATPIWHPSRNPVRPVPGT